MEHLSQIPSLVLSNLIFIVILCGLTYRSLYTKKSSHAKNILVIFMCFAFCLFSFWGADWFGYQSYFEMANSRHSYNVPMEVPYIWLMSDVCNTYLEFRSIVWGCSLILFIFTLKNLRLDIGLSLFFFCSIYLIYFSYARVTLAISMMFYGYSCIWSCKNKSNVFKIIWGISWIILSFYFHKSAILGIMTIFIAISIYNMGKGALIMSIIAFPIIILLMDVFWQEYFPIITMDEGTLSEYANTGAVHLDSVNTQIGISTIINRILERTPYYLLAYASFMELYKPSIAHPDNIRAFFIVEFLTVVFASVFIFDFGINTSTLYGRFLRFAQIPSVIVLAYMYRASIETKTVKLACCIGLLNCAYNLLYSYYNTFTI